MEQAWGKWGEGGGSSEAAPVATSCSRLRSPALHTRARSTYRATHFFPEGPIESWWVEGSVGALKKCRTRAIPRSFELAARSALLFALYVSCLDPLRRLAS